MLRLKFLCGLSGLALLANISSAASDTPPPLASPIPPAPPSLSALVDSLPPADLQQVIPLLKNNFINANALSEIELNRAQIEGLIARLGHGVMLLPDRASAPMELPSPSFNEVLAGHIGYLRAGALTPANLQALDAALKKFAAQKTDALVLDLRASPPTNDFATAAEFAKRFAPRGKILFVLQKPASHQERTFTSDRDPSFQGMIMVLTDGETSGAAEVLAGVLRLYDKAMQIGEATAGRAVEYSDLPLNSGKILRVAVGEAVLPAMNPLYPDGLKPDLQVQMPAAEKHQIFQDSLTQGMSRFVFETERPHLNEAALLAGRNPELDAATGRLRGQLSAGATPHDPVVQRAVDLITSLGVFQNR